MGACSKAVAPQVDSMNHWSKQQEKVLKMLEDFLGNSFKDLHQGITHLENAQMSGADLQSLKKAMNANKLGAEVGESKDEIVSRLCGINQARGAAHHKRDIAKTHQAPSSRGYSPGSETALTVALTPPPGLESEAMWPCDSDSSAPRSVEEMTSPGDPNAELLMAFFTDLDKQMD